MRYMKMSSHEEEVFLRANDLDYLPISSAEKEQFSNELLTILDANVGFELEKNHVNIVEHFRGISYFKVRWTDVLDLVARRQVLVHNGFAFVPKSELVSVILSVFKARLSKSLAIGCQTYAEYTQDERVNSLVSKLQNSYVSSNINIDDETFTKLTPENIDVQSRESFPLCMKACYNKLKQESHLQYNARQQFWLFVKGCGFTLNQAMSYFEREFCKNAKISSEEFRKRYAYNIRHAYGQEGKRQDYSPHTCVRVLNLPNPNPSQVHGCPFKVLGENNLKVLLSKENIDGSDMKEVLECAKRKEYQLACTKLFQAKHKNASTENVGNSPNAYYVESRKYLQLKSGLAESQQQASQA